MKCAFCSSENNAESKFCKKCGKPLNTRPISWFKVMIGIVIILAITLISLNAIYQKEQERYQHEYGLQEGSSVGLTVTSWSTSGETFYVNLHNNSELWIKSVVLELILIDSAIKDEDCGRPDRDETYYTFKLQFEEDKLLSPYSSSEAHSVHAGPILTSNKYHHGSDKCGKRLRLGRVQYYRNIAE